MTLEQLQRSVMEEWGFNWKTSPVCRRVLGPEVYDTLLVELAFERENAS